ncbi:sensor histidine kinase [Flavobacteriaceae bacterium MHTCC 0001]
MKKYLILILLGASSLNFFGQTKKVIDSLKLELNKKQADTITAWILNDLSYYYLYENIDSSLVYGKKAYNYAKRIKYPTVEAKANLYLGNAFLYTNEYDSAHYYYNVSNKIHDKNELNKSPLYSSLGMLYKNENNYEKAIEVYMEGIKYDEENSFEYGKFIKICNLINVYAILGEYDKSITSGLEVVEIAKRTDDTNIKYYLGTLLNNIGTYYSKLEETDKALDYFNQSLMVNTENENKKEIARNYVNIGSIYENENELEKALELLKKALPIREEFKDQDELIEIHLELGAVYGKMKQNSLSNHHFSKALLIAEGINNLSLLSEVYLAKSKSNLFQNNYKSALANFEMHIQFKDSIREKDLLKNIQEIETKYQTEKKDKEIATQQLELREKETQIQKKKTQSNYMLGAILFLAISTILLTFLFKQRQKRKNQELLTIKREFQIKTLESLIEGEEKERSRVAKELHDGVNGDLSAIKYKLSSLLEMNNKVINEAIVMIDDSCKQVRAISHNLIPPSLESFDVVEAVQIYCDNLNEVSAKVTIRFQHIGGPVDMPKKDEVHIFRIIQELVGNSLKHSEGSNINVQISSRENTIQITVEDDGKGFDKNNTTSNGIGLGNVQSRIDYLGATLDFMSNTKGTSYTVEIDKNNSNEN